MIYSFDILAAHGLYSGWAHSEAEMLAKFLAEHPSTSGKDQPYIFLAGGAPVWLDYDEYAQLREVEKLDERFIRILDDRLGTLYTKLEERAIAKIMGEVD